MSRRRWGSPWCNFKMTEQEKNFSSVDTTETTPAANEESGKKPSLMRGARDFIENTWSNLKGKDLNQAVEEYTSEMTLVAEGLSEDQAALRKDHEKLAARADKLLEQQKSTESTVKALQEQLEQAGKSNAALQKRLDEVEKALKAKPAKQGLSAILRQATWIVGILCAAWVIVTILKLIGG